MYSSPEETIGVAGLHLTAVLLLVPEVLLTRPEPPGRDEFLLGRSYPSQSGSARVPRRVDNSYGVGIRSGRETQMDWNIIEGKWKELKGKAREEWGKLTDDELEEVGGKKDKLVGKLQQKYGYASDEAARRADEWAKRQDAK
jgi:uncharacterized protein YjbJ (UPF0337 family)